jgi:hypothetical protein
MKYVFSCLRPRVVVTGAEPGSIRVKPTSGATKSNNEGDKFFTFNSGTSLRQRHLMFKGGKTHVDLQPSAMCLLSVEPRERWVREKIYESAPNGNGPSYFRYHADLFVGEEITVGKNAKWNWKLPGRLRVRLNA